MGKEIKIKKGISLIVLVITIIVMIILATAIILSLSSSGIIGRANEAKIKNDIASAKELVAVANSEWLLMTETKQEENGGTFVEYAENKLIDAGYNPDELVIEEDGTVEECVAMIGKTKFATITEAIYSIEDAAETTIVVMANINVVNTIYIERTQNIIIDLNGYAISGVNIDVIQNQGTLTIKDTSSAGTGRIESAVDAAKHAKYDATFDYDDDGYISYADGNMLFRHTTGIEVVTDEDMLARFDVNKDGSVNNSDSTYLLITYGSVRYAINNSSIGTLNIDETAEGKLIGKPTAVYYN